MNQPKQFELKDLTRPVRLHCERKKFWEMTLVSLGEIYQTTARAGKLDSNGDEVPNTIDSRQREHKDLDSSIAHLEEHVGKKLLKGYEFFEGDPHDPQAPKKPSPMKPEVKPTLERYQEILHGRIEDHEPKTPPEKKSVGKIHVNVHPPQSLEKDPIHYSFEEKQLLENFKQDPVYKRTHNIQDPKPKLDKIQEEPAPKKDIRSQMLEDDFENDKGGLIQTDSPKNDDNNAIYDEEPFTSFGKGNLKRRANNNRDTDDEGNNLYGGEVDLPRKRLLEEDDLDGKDNEWKLPDEPIRRGPKQIVSEGLKDYLFEMEDEKPKESSQQVQKPKEKLLVQGFDLEDEDDEKEKKDSLLSGRGMLSGDPDEFKGEMLTFELPKYLKYCKVQVLQTFLKVEYGISGDKRATDVEIKRYKTRKDAVLQAQMKIEDKVASGYKKEPALFKYDFTEDELGIRKVPAMSGDLSYRSGGGTHDRGKRSHNRFQNRDSDDDDNDSHGGGVGTKGKSKKNTQNSYLGLPKKNYDEYSATSRISSQEFEEYELLAAQFAFDDEDDDAPRHRPRSASPFTRSGKASRRRDSDNGSSDDENDDNGMADEKFPLGKPKKGCPELMLAQVWDGQKDPKNWYISEKLDGIRVYWDGQHIYSRGKKKYYPPMRWKLNFPDCCLDGELYAGPGNSGKMAYIAKKDHAKESDWEGVTFYVFDAPELKLPFKKRYKKMKEFFTHHVKSQHIKLLSHKVCENRLQLQAEIERVEKFGGEGLMLRDPNSFYEFGRTSSLLKVKPYHDEEALVIGYEEGKGKYSGLEAGSGIRVRNKEKAEFVIKVGLNMQIRRNPPKIGSKITYKFTTLSNTGIPKNPTFLRVRDDD